MGSLTRYGFLLVMALAISVTFGLEGGLRMLEHVRHVEQPVAVVKIAQAPANPSRPSSQKIVTSTTQNQNEKTSSGLGTKVTTNPLLPDLPSGEEIRTTAQSTLVIVDQVEGSLPEAASGVWALPVQIAHMVLSSIRYLLTDMQERWVRPDGSLDVKAIITPPQNPFPFVPYKPKPVPHDH